MKLAIWLGAAPPRRQATWLVGALAAARRLGPVTAIAAGAEAWLEAAADHAVAAGASFLGIATDLELDYLGWAQIAAAAARHAGATVIFVDEASRDGRTAEVAAIAELRDAAQVIGARSLVRDGDALGIEAIAGARVLRLRVRAPAVIGVRIAAPRVLSPAELARRARPLLGARIELEPDAVTPPPAPLRRIGLAALGLDAKVLGHRAVPPPGAPWRTVERAAVHLAVHVQPDEDR